MAPGAPGANVSNDFAFFRGGWSSKSVVHSLRVLGSATCVATPHNIGRWVCYISGWFGLSACSLSATHPLVTHLSTCLRGCQHVCLGWFAPKAPRRCMQGQAGRHVGVQRRGRGVQEGRRSSGLAAAASASAGAAGAAGSASSAAGSVGSHDSVRRLAAAAAMARSGGERRHGVVAAQISRGLQGEFRSTSDKCMPNPESKPNLATCGDAHWLPCYCLFPPLQLSMVLRFRPRMLVLCLASVAYLLVLTAFLFLMPLPDISCRIAVSCVARLFLSLVFVRSVFYCTQWCQDPICLRSRCTSHSVGLGVSSSSSPVACVLFITRIGARACVAS